MAADKVWLRDSLAEALGWDPSVAEEVVEAISSAQGKEERDEIVEVSRGALHPDTYSAKPVSGLSTQDCAIYPYRIPDCCASSCKATCVYPGVSRWRAKCQQSGGQIPAVLSTASSWGSS